MQATLVSAIMGKNAKRIIASVAIAGAFSCANQVTYVGSSPSATTGGTTGSGTPMPKCVPSKDGINVCYTPCGGGSVNNATQGTCDPGELCTHAGGMSEDFCEKKCDPTSPICEAGQKCLYNNSAPTPEGFYCVAAPGEPQVNEGDACDSWNCPAGMQRAWDKPTQAYRCRVLCSTALPGSCKKGTCTSLTNFGSKGNDFPNAPPNAGVCVP